MKIIPRDQSIEVQFPAGGFGEVALSEIESIDLETMPTMTVDVDFVSIGFENGEFLELSDEAIGFREACVFLSSRLGIHPEIAHRFPIPDGFRQRVYEKL